MSGDCVIACQPGQQSETLSQEKELYVYVCVYIYIFIFIQTDI